MGISKVITADLQADIVTVYDPTKTFKSGNFSQKLLNGQYCIGAPLTKWQDVITASGETIIKSKTGSSGVRVYGITAVATGAFRLVCGTFSTTTGVWTYVGKTIIQVPTTPSAAVHTVRDYFIDDTNTSLIQIIFSTVATGTNSTHLGGQYRAYKLTLADFTLAPPTIPTATVGDQKGVYFENDPSFIGINNSATVMAALAGCGYRYADKMCYSLNGTLASATWSIRKFDFTSVPTITNSGAVTVTVASPGKVVWASSGLSNNDVVIPISGTLPTGLTINTPYFVRNVSGSDFEVSATFGGASINTTGSAGSATFIRAYGITTNSFVLATAAQPIVTGSPVALLTGAVSCVDPVSGHAANNGVPCLFVGCASASLLFPLSEITSGAVSIPSLLVTNLLGATGEATAPTATHVTWSTAFDRFVFVTNITRFVAKKCVNNVIEDQFGAINNQVLEGVSQTNLITQLGMAAIVSIDAVDGWIHIVGSTVGQRGIISHNTGSSWKLGTAKLITKVFDISDILSYIGFATALQNTEKTTGAKYYYRTNLECDFSDSTTGWILLPSTGLMNTLSAVGVTAIQFMLLPQMMDGLVSNPFQAIELFFAYTPIQQIAKDWLGWVGQTSQDGISPAYSAYQVGKTLSSAVAMRFIAVDKVTKVVVALADTDTDFASFDKTSNSGSSWSAMTGANDYPLTQFTSGVRYAWGGAVPSDVVISWAVK